MSDLRSMLAVPFTAPGQSFTFTLGGTDYTVTLTSGTYRVSLAPSSGDVKDCLRSLQDALNAASPILPGGVAFTVTLSPTTGIVSITCTSAFVFNTLHGTTLGAVLGYTGASGGAATTQTAARQPWYCAWFLGLYGGQWTPRRSGARERAAGGEVYTFAGTLTLYDRELTADMVPWDPALCSAEGIAATPFWPAAEYMGDVAGTSTAARAWGLVDVWAAAQNCLCALAIGDWQTQRSSTTDRYWTGYLASDVPEDVSRQDERWQAFLTLKWSFVLPTTGASATRA